MSCGGDSLETDDAQRSPMVSLESPGLSSVHQGDSNKQSQDGLEIENAAV